MRIEAKQDLHYKRTYLRVNYKGTKQEVMHSLLLYLSGNPSAVIVERTLLTILEILDPEKNDINDSVRNVKKLKIKIQNTYTQVV